MICFELAILLGYSAFIGNMGANALSAYQISMQYVLLAAIPTYGLNQSAVFLVARETGANRIQQAKRIGTTCIMLGGGISLLLFGITSGIAKELMRPFINVEDPENEGTIANARALFIVNGATQIFDSVRIITGGAIQGGFQNTKYAMISGIFGLGLFGLPLAYALGFSANLGVVGVALARGIGLSLGGSFLVSYWYRKIKNWLLPSFQNRGVVIEEIPSEQLQSFDKLRLVEAPNSASVELTARLTSQDVERGMEFSNSHTLSIDSKISTEENKKSTLGSSPPPPIIFTPKASCELPDSTPTRSKKCSCIIL